MTMTLIKQGAEAKIYSGLFLGKDVIIKERFCKKYRHPELDSRLTKERMRAELRGILRCKAAGIRTPAIYFIENARNAIYLERIQDVETVNVFIGSMLKNSEQGDPANKDNVQQLIVLAQEIGLVIGKMHSSGVIHGDLTTSNILVNCSKGELSAENKPELVLIDFGLSHVEFNAEDKGVDLYVLERALSSTYSNIPWFFEVILEIYKKENFKEGEEVYKKLEEIRLRGRKRTMIG